ncbi:helix-turn-helix transcriptional regulator [Natronorubrum sp. DTA28]|uniref:helix-turn-helix transcriptional regulator n=1 Tax=Natronorubrum sp. DTA28 TaxID=3447019 RepID=UPI003F841AF6
MDSKGLWALLWVLVVVGCAVALLPVASVGAVADAGATGATVQEDEEPVEREELDEADEVHIDVSLLENGSATFEVDYRYFLENENNTEEDWEELREQIDSDPEAFTEAEMEGWDSIRAEGQNETGREMNISNATVSTDESPAPRDIGHVQFTFEWSSFAYVELTEITAGDALSGFTLIEGTTLQITGPEGYAVHEHEPTADSTEPNAVYWDGGGTEFNDDQPRVVFIENGDSAAEATEPDDGLPTTWLAVLAALGLLATGAVIGWWLRHGRDDKPAPGGDVAAPPPSNEAPASGNAAGPPPELLSNEERVLRLLEERGGRIKQQEVVAELDWTEAKTSQVVGSLREDDEIEVFRIGRENVLSLPDEDEE